MLRALRFHVQAPAVVHHCSLCHTPEGAECRKQQCDLLCKWPWDVEGLTLHRRKGLWDGSDLERVTGNLGSPLSLSFSLSSLPSQHTHHSPKRPLHCHLCFLMTAKPVRAVRSPGDLYPRFTLGCQPQGQPLPRNLIRTRGIG